MVFIPAGEFDMGDHHDAHVWSLPVHTVCVDSFHISRHEITNQRYCDYLNVALSQGLIEVRNGRVYAAPDGYDTYCYTTQGWTTSHMTWNGGSFAVVSGKEDHPMVGVSWFGAVAYCNWRSTQEGYEACYNLSTWECDFSKYGYRLPTEAEWEYSARGGLFYFRYPWGNNINGSKANYWGSDDPYESESVATTPVGYYAANGYGLYDTAGNVFEWCNDWFDVDYYSTSPYDNPKGTPSGTYRVLRGGNWHATSWYCRVGRRHQGSPDGDNGPGGFRVVLDLN